MKSNYKLNKGLQDIHIFQFESGYSGLTHYRGIVRRVVHKTLAKFPVKESCSDQPLHVRSFFWITLLRSNKQEWPVRFEENLDNLNWVIRGWKVTLPSSIAIDELRFVNKQKNNRGKK